MSGLAGNPAMPPHDGYPTPPLPLRPVGRRLAAAFDRLGWHWWPIPAGVVSEDYDGRPACNGCSACAAGCARGSMSKFSLSVWPKALDAGVDLRPFARVERLERGADGAPYRRGLRRPAHRHRGTSRRPTWWSSPANGVGTPRLLLMSDNLANGSDQVGRNLMHHTLVACEMWVDEPLHSHMGFIGALIGRSSPRPTPRAASSTASTSTARPQAMPAASRSASSRPPPRPGAGPPRLVPPPLQPWLRACSRSATTCRRRATASRCPTREKDADGLPAPKIAYAPHENDLRMMRFALERLEDIAQAADAFDYRLHDYMSKDGVYQTPGLASARHLPDGRRCRRPR